MRELINLRIGEMVLRVRQMARHPAVAAGLAWLRHTARAGERWADRRRKAVAIALSLALHIGVILLFMIDLRAGFSARGDRGLGRDDGNGMAVEMVSSDALALQLMKVKAPVDIAPEEEVQALEIPEDALNPTIAPLVSDLTEARLPSPAVSASAAGSGGNGDNGTDDDALWQAIAPCWTRMADAGTLPVTLKISFDSDGGIASPPVIDRDATNPSDARTQRSEVLALQALSQCGTYAMAEGRSDVRVNFPVP